VDEKRRQTCLERYGNPNYRNEEAKKLSNEVFAGGHPLSDPVIREKARETKKELYGDPNFTNREKAKLTCLDKYGVDNIAKIDSVIKKRVQTNIERYGKAINYTKPPLFSKEELIDLHVNQGKYLPEIAKIYGITPEGVSYWAKKLGVVIQKTPRIRLGGSVYPDEEYKKAIELFVKYSSERGVSRGAYKDGVLGVPPHALESRYGTWSKFVIACGIEPPKRGLQP